MPLQKVVFNIAKGGVSEFVRLVQTNGFPNSAIGVMLLATTGLETDAVLIDKDTVAQVLAGTTNEVANSGYARAVLTDADLSPVTPDDTNDRMVIDLPDTPMGSIEPGDSISKVLTYFDPDTTTSTDADRVPLTMEDFFLNGAPVIPDGSPVTANITGIFEAD